MNKLKLFIYLAFIVGLLLLLKFKEGNYSRIATYHTATTFNAVIEIPAGTNKIIQYNPNSNKFKQTGEKENENMIEFLPYPVNFGFIPSTFKDTARGGNGEAIDIMVLAEHLDVKTVIEVIPIGIMKISNENEKNKIIVSVPANEELQLIQVKKFENLKQNYPELLNVLEKWFLSYNKNSQTENIEWENEKVAINEIVKWSYE